MDVHPSKNGINRYWSIPIYGCLWQWDIQPYIVTQATKRLYLCRIIPWRCRETKNKKFLAYRWPRNKGSFQIAKGNLNLIGFFYFLFHQCFASFPLLFCNMFSMFYLVFSIVVNPINYPPKSSPCLWQPDVNHPRS